MLLVDNIDHVAVTFIQFSVVILGVTFDFNRPFRLGRFGISS